MTARSPRAFMLSAAFHAAVIALLLLFAVVADRREKVTPRVLELVAGSGDNFAATVAPRLGTPDGVKLDLPRPEPETAAPTPVKPAPPPPKTAPVTPPVETTVPNFKRQIQRKVWAAESKAKREIAKERVEEAKRLKKEEFDRQQRERAKVAAGARSGGTPKIAKIDAEGIRNGVLGGSTENKVGGAGGKALVAADGSPAERYFALLVQRVKNALGKPPDLGDDLVVTVVGHISATGRLSNVRVTKSSGDEAFDRAVIAAFARVEMPAHPEKKGEDFELVFRTKDEE